MKYNKPLTDKSPMPYGVHEGKTMANVPAAYLLWLYDNDKCGGKVRAYIKENYEILGLER